MELIKVEEHNIQFNVDFKKFNESLKALSIFINESKLFSLISNSIPVLKMVKNTSLKFKNFGYDLSRVVNYIKDDFTNKKLNELKNKLNKIKKFTEKSKLFFLICFFFPKLKELREIFPELEGYVEKLEKNLKTGNQINYIKCPHCDEMTDGSLFKCEICCEKLND